MLPEVRETLFQTIGARAEQERAIVDYIIGLVQANTSTLTEAFAPDAALQDDTSELLYSGAAGALALLEKHYLATGVVITHQQPNFDGRNAPMVRTGWAGYFSIHGMDQPNAKGTIPFLFGLTAEGISVVNGLRAVRGKNSLQEQRRLRQEG